MTETILYGTGEKLHEMPYGERKHFVVLLSSSEIDYDHLRLTP